MPPPRDSFGLALAALRQRLRAGVDLPGAPLPIALIAQDLRLSPTPVREALSRLAGEDLVEKIGHTYTRPRLDGPTLAELYHLRLLHILGAAAPGRDRRAATARWPSRPDVRFSAQLAQSLERPQGVIEGLFLEQVLTAGDLILAQAYRRTAERLAPFAAVEANLFPDLASEALDLVSLFDAGRDRALRGAVRAYHRRRIAAAAGLVRLAEAGKYRLDII